MIGRLLRVVGVVLLILALEAQVVIPATQAAGNPPDKQFVRQSASDLRLQGKVFRFAGANNYYLMYKSQFMVDDVLAAAAGDGKGFRVLRIWGSLEIGNQDGSNSIQGKADGVYFQYWDGTAPAYNDGADGLQHLDYVIYRAGQEGLKLVIPFVNNWNAFGGMDQYVRWASGQYHDQFYTDPTIRTWYKSWISHLLNRTNSYTGVKYKDDPTIMTWELANEPRCVSAGAYPRSDSCTTQTLIDWASDVSAYVKSIDANHLVSVGDEGFYCIPGATDWTENCGEGVDTIAFASLDSVDVMSYHLYPDSWGKDAAWGTQWIKRHIQDAKALHKPSMLGEFGLLDKSTRNPVYREWTDAVLTSGGNGALYWILSGHQDDGTYYADYDGFTVYESNPVFIALRNFAKMMNAGKPLVFPPVADDDSAVTEFDTQVTLSTAANDVAYGGATVLPGSIDLDPSAAGQQTTVAVYGGTFSLQSDGKVLFTPTSGFSGKSQASYTIKDSAGRTSNVATITVTVKPNPSGALTLFSFETGTEGWASASWQSNAGTVAQTTSFHTDGTHGLQVTTADGGWFGVAFSPPVDLSGKTTIKYDLATLAVGTSTNIAIQAGDGWTWYQGAWGWANPGTTTTVSLDLTSLSIPTGDLAKVQSIYIWFNAGGTFDVDNVRAE